MDLRSRWSGLGINRSTGGVVSILTELARQYPQKHLANFIGKLQVDAYAGFEALFVASKPGVTARIVEIACFAHLRRKFFDLFEALASPIAKEALERIGRLYVIEKAIRGRSAEERQAQRQQHAVPILTELHAWMIEQSVQFDKGSAFATAFNYAFNNWDALQRYTQDGHLEIDNNIAERSVRGAGVGRKNYLFFGSEIDIGKMLYHVRGPRLRGLDCTA